MPELSKIRNTQTGVDYDIVDTQARLTIAKKALHLSVSSFNSFPKDISNSNITTTMRVVNIEWGTPSSITSKVGWNTNTAGHLVLSGTITSTGTTAEIDLIDFG